MLDRFDCYERCVQSPRHITQLLRAVHGRGPIVLREDFAGTAACSRNWVAGAREAGTGARAVAVELDAEAIVRARDLVNAEGLADRVRLIRGDATASLEEDEAGSDVVFVGNFSVGYIHNRAGLVRYARLSRDRLSRGGGGILACDTYGGASAFKLGGLERKHPGRAGEVIRYSWLHERADPLTGMVENSISFRIERDGDVVREWPRAFTYRWRLWSIAELRDAMAEAGFASTEVHKDVNIAPGEPARPVTDPADLGEDWIVLVVGRA